MSVLIDFLCVFLGGGLGAISRYAVTLIPSPSESLGGFPLWTFFINLLGSFIIGILDALIGEGLLSKHWTNFSKVGLMGGFTTFSSFSLDAVSLFEKGNYLVGSLYVLLSVALCLLGCFLGQICGKAIAKAIGIRG